MTLQERFHVVDSSMSLLDIIAQKNFFDWALVIWWSAQPSERRGINDLPPKDVANAINSALLEPLEEYRLASALFPLSLEESFEFLEVSEDRVYRTLNSLNPSKACGPDRIPNWLLKEYAELLAVPVARILNSS